MFSKFKNIWEDVKSKKKASSYFSKVREISYDDFKLLKDDFDPKVAEELVSFF